MTADYSGSAKNLLRAGDTLQKLILANVIVYISFAVLRALMRLFMTSLDLYFVPSQWLAVPASLPALAFKPWTLFTYMFYHEEFFHILFNMLWLWWMGKIFMEYLGPKKLFSTYILGGFCGALLYIAAYNSFPLFHDAVSVSHALGASAGVLAITVAAATLVPDYRVGILFLGPVPLKYIALVTVLLDLISVSGSNAGGHIAHLGGALFGFLYIRQLRGGRDLAGGFNRLMDRFSTVFKSEGRRNVYRKRTSRDEDYISDKKAIQDKTDAILDKISKSGYGSLTNEERDFLFKSSRDQ